VSEHPPDRAAFPWERQSPPPIVTGTGWAPPPDQPAVEGGSWVQPKEPALPIADVKLGGYIPRIVAYIIDAALVSTWLIFVLTVIPAPRYPATSSSAGYVILIFLLVLIVGFGYLPFCWSHGGQTIGLRLCGLRVVHDPDAARIGWMSAILRLLGFPVNSFFLYLGWIWVFIDKRRRGWHDLLAGTVVVDEHSLQEFRSRQSTGVG
jgi:uncharacterized RDD family membrane protein YckC